MKRKSISKRSPSIDEAPYAVGDRRSAANFWKAATPHQGIEDLRRRRGQRGPQKAPTKTLVSIRLSRDVITYFKAKGAGWQTRIDDTLKSAIGKK